jgi:hypothetical protein
MKVAGGRSTVPKEHALNISSNIPHTPAARILAKVIFWFGWARVRMAEFLSRTKLFRARRTSILRVRPRPFSGFAKAARNRELSALHLTLGGSFDRKFDRLARL